MRVDSPCSRYRRIILVAFFIAFATAYVFNDAAAQWVQETADGSQNVVGWYTSITLDASGHPRVSYYDATTDDLNYAWKSGGIWLRETADGAPNQVGLYSSLALDDAGNPHASYLDFSAGDLQYARKTNGVWMIERAASANDVGYYSSLALDASGNPHVSYFDETTDNLKYARKVAGAWTRETADGSRTPLASTVQWHWMPSGTCT